MPGIGRARMSHAYCCYDGEADAAATVAIGAAADDQLIHFGKGQTQTAVTLPPGKHTGAWRKFCR
jgi:hypothetical protein